jgi:hypothetical protein
MAPAGLRALVRMLRERAEFMDTVRRDLDIQFQRIAQLQGELDRLKRALTRRDRSFSTGDIA